MSRFTFYDKRGNPCAYTNDEEHIYLFNGTPVAYLYNKSVYSYTGTHLGFFSNGWVLDNSGYRVFFTEDASGGPVKPVKRVKPVKNVRSTKPVKSVRQVKPVKPTSKLEWSRFSCNKFFE